MKEESEAALSTSLGALGLDQTAVAEIGKEVKKLMEISNVQFD